MENKRIMKLTTSQVKCFKTCRKRYELEYVECLKPIETPKALEIGTLYHEGLEAILTGKDIAEVQKIIIGKQNKNAVKHGIDYEPLNALVAIEMCRAWEHQSGYKNWIITGVEKKFEVSTGYAKRLMGKIDGKAAATYDYNYERLISVEESGSLDYVTKPEVVETVYKEYLEGYGVRVDGGAWDASAKSFAPAGSPFSLTVNADLIAESSYDEATKTLTCKVAKDKTSEVLGQAEDLPVDITLTIVDDGASINAVFITYTIPAAGKDTDAIEVTIKTFYTYRLEIINIDLGVEE